MSANRLTHRKPVEPSTPRPSIQDQVAMNTSNLKDCLSYLRNCPPKPAPPDRLDQTAPLMNESVFPLSVRVNHPPTSVSVHFQNNQFVLGMFPKCRHHPRQVRCLALNVQLFKVVLFLLVTHARKTM